MDAEGGGYEQLIDSIGSNIQEINSCVQKLESLTGKSSENEEFSKVLLKANQLSKETNGLMKTLVNVSNTSRSPALKVQRERLMGEMINVLNRLQKAQRSAAQFEKQSVQEISAHEREISMQLNDDQDEDDSTNVTKRQLKIEQIRHIEEIKERSEVVKQIEEDIGDITLIMKDLARIVHDQGEMVDSIEANVEHATSNVQQGAVDMERAVYYRREVVKKKFMLLFFFILALIIFFIFFYFYMN